VFVSARSPQGHTINPLHSRRCLTYQISSAYICRLSALLEQAFLVLVRRLLLAVQLLPRSPIVATNFDPVFKPPAPDPPRNLPPVIRAGTMVPPLQSSSLQENVLPSAVEPVDSSSGTDGSNKTGITTLVILILWDICLLMICIYCSTLLGPCWRHQPGGSFLDKWTRTNLKKLESRDEGSRNNIRGDRSVCICSSSVYATFDLFLFSNPMDAIMQFTSVYGCQQLLQLM
jgi:hypothetical protein